MSIKHLCLIVALISVLNNCWLLPAANAMETADDNSAGIVKLTDEILLKEIGLERFYLKYKIIANHEPKWRELRYFLGQQASFGLFLGGDIVGLTDSGAHLHSARNVSVPGLKDSVRVELIGSIIGSASSGLELCSNGLLALKNKKYKQDPATALLHMKNEVQQVRALLAKRADLVSHEKLNPAYKAYMGEGLLMQEYCDWCVYEFAKIYADAKSYQAGANVYYFLNTANNVLFGAAGILALKSFNNPQYTGSSIVTAIVGDGISVISAPAQVVTQKCLKKHYFKKVYKNLSEKPYDVEVASDESRLNLHEDVSAVNENTLAQLGPIKNRLAAYDLWDQRYDEYISKETQQLRRHEKIALQSLIFGPLISGTFLAQDTLGSVAWYGNKRRPTRADDLVFSGFVTGAAGAGVGLAANTWYYLDEHRNQRRLKREGNMPEQLMQKRLNTLDEVEILIKTPDFTKQ